MKIQFTAQEAADITNATNACMKDLLEVLCEKELVWDTKTGVITVEINTDAVCAVIQEQRPLWKAVAGVVTAFSGYMERMEKFDVRKLFAIKREG
jgi:predicted alpha/beta hydrolase